MYCHKGREVFPFSRRVKEELSSAAVLPGFKSAQSDESSMGPPWLSGLAAGAALPTGHSDGSSSLFNIPPSAPLLPPTALTGLLADTAAAAFCVSAVTSDSTRLDEDDANVAGFTVPCFSSAGRCPEQSAREST